MMQIITACDIPKIIYVYVQYMYIYILEQNVKWKNKLSINDKIIITTRYYFLVNIS